MDAPPPDSGRAAAPGSTGPGPGPGTGQRNRLLAAAGVGALVLLLVGVLIGRGLGSDPSAAGPAPTAGPTPGPGPTSAPPTAPASPPPPFTGPTLFGLSVPVGQRTAASTVVTRIRQEYGRLPVARIFSNDPPPASWNDDATLAALGDATSVVYSFKAPPTQVAAGAFDDRIRSFLASKPAGISVWFVYYHEPEDDVIKGQFTPQQFVAATEHVAPIARASGAYATTILMQYTLAPNSGRDWQDYYTPAIDVLGWDAYNTGARGETPTYKPASSFVDPVLAVSKQTGKPFGWGEFGSPCIETDPDCSQRAAWLDSIGRAFRDSGAQFATYWNRPALNGGTDYSLSDGQSKSAYRKFISP